MSAVVSLRCGRLRLDQSSFSILLGCFGRRSSSKGRTTPVENRRLVSVPPKEKLFGPRPVDLRCSNVGHARRSVDVKGLKCGIKDRGQRGGWPLEDRAVGHHGEKNPKTTNLIEIIVNS